jgi:hypothetical protein
VVFLIADPLAYFRRLIMRTTRNTLFRYCAIAACAVIVANGCMFPRTATGPAFTANKLEPGQFCPGDTLRASFDYLGSDTCRDWDTITCAATRPNIRITSVPESFPPTEISDFLGHVDFAPAADRVDVTFHNTRGNIVAFPSERADGTRTSISRPSYDETLVATRITGTVESTLTHGGLCAGSTVVHASASLVSPSTSPNLRLNQLCNINTVPVRVVLTGSPSGAFHEQDLMPGECFNTSMPGVVSDIDRSTDVGIRSLSPDPTARCSGDVDDNPAEPLMMLARRSCG